MAIEPEAERLSQAENLTHFLGRMQPTDMVVVYNLPTANGTRGGPDYFVCCTMIPSAGIEQSLSTSSWESQVEPGLPGTVTEYKENGEESVTYHRFGNDEGLESLVFRREFHGVREDYLEISEEFRLFHNLYHDRQGNRYFKIDDDGDETLVAVIEESRNLVKIRLQELRQFLAVKEMHLSLQFDYRVYSRYSLADLGVPEGGREQRDGHTCWNLYYGDVRLASAPGRSVSILHGKRLIEPLPKALSEFPGFAERTEQNYVDFVIGLDHDGRELEYTCNPKALANNFGANPEAPHFLTKVDFHKQVLDRYYQEPSKYEVEDGILRCGYLWHLRMDNHHMDKVCVWLGDLSSLSYKQQLHWRSFNFVSGTEVSPTYFQRQILGQPADSDRIEDRFFRQYDDLYRLCLCVLGWPVLLPLDSRDKHHMRSIRVPATNEQQEFDELVLGLAKTMIDSLNEKQLRALVPNYQTKGLTGSISILESALQYFGEINNDSHIGFLRSLQDLRSAGSAHRKGGKYQQITRRLGIGSQDLSTAFSSILTQAVECLDYLNSFVSSVDLSIAGQREEIKQE